MADLFTDAEERTALVHDAAGQLGLASWVVEKDLWVCWLLARLNQIEGLPKLTFKGGTSLSKVHKLIERFSEDIDLTFSRDGWGFEGERDPLSADISENERKRLLQAIADRAAATVRDQVVPSLQASCRGLDAGWSVTIDAIDDQAVLFAFPSPVPGYTYNKPVVKAEFGARGDPWPTAPSPVRPYLDDVHPGLAASAVVEVTTLAAERTFWEKATLLHALHHADDLARRQSTAAGVANGGQRATRLTRKRINASPPFKLARHLRSRPPQSRASGDDAAPRSRRTWPAAAPKLSARSRSVRGG